MEEIHKILFRTYGVESHFRGPDMLIVFGQDTCVEIHKVGDCYDVKDEGSDLTRCYTTIPEVIAYSLGVIGQ